MKKTIGIEGMGCVHCEKRVKDALEALPGVAEAAVSHTARTAVVTLHTQVPDDALIAAVNELGKYRVTGVQSLT